MYAPMPWLGGLLFLATLRPFAQKRTFVTVTNMVAATCCLIAFILWPDENAIALDHIVDVTGLGFLIGRLTLTLAVVLHTIAVCVSIGMWNRLYKLLMIPTAVFATVYFLFWVQLHGAGVPHVETLFYYGYHGRPDAALWMSIWRGVTIIWYSSVTVSIYALVAMRAQDQWRWTSVVTGAAFAGSVVMGFLAIDEALLDRAGQPSPALLNLFAAMFVGCCGIIVVVYLIYTNLRPLWVVLQRLRQYPEIEAKHRELLAEEEQLLILRQQVRDLNLRLSDQLVLLRTWADPELVRAVEELCDEEGVVGHDREQTVEAIRILSLHPDHIHQLRRFEDQAFASRDDAALTAQEYANLAEKDLWFYGGVNMIIALALAAERLGVTFHFPPDERHRRLAGIVRKALARYQQPPELLAAYRADVARRAAARQDYLSILSQTQNGIPRTNGHGEQSASNKNDDQKAIDGEWKSV